MRDVIRLCTGTEEKFHSKGQREPQIMRTSGQVSQIQFPTPRCTELKEPLLVCLWRGFKDPQLYEKATKNVLFPKHIIYLYEARLFFVTYLNQNNILQQSE